MVILGTWLNFYFSDAEVIKRDFNKLAKEISKVAQETPLLMALNMGKIKARLHAPCTILISEQGYEASLDQDLLIRALIYYRNQYTEIDLTFTDFSIEQSQNNTTVQTTLHLHRKNQEEDIKNVELMEFTLKKHEKNWLIHQAIIPGILVE